MFYPSILNIYTCRIGNAFVLFIKIHLLRFFMEPLQNEFSWSLTRHNNFTECKRKYYYIYYGSWGGWEKGCPDDVRTLYVLKQLKSRSMWAGEVVHDQVEYILKQFKNTGKIPDLKYMLNKTYARMKEEYLFSKDKGYWQEPKRCALYEHEYDIELDDDRWKLVRNNVENCLNNFYGSRFITCINDMKRYHILPVEKFDTFILFDTKIWVKMDFAYEDKEMLNIIDWKTGKQSDDNNIFQLIIYSLFAIFKWNYYFQNIITSEFNLNTNSEIAVELKPEKIEGVKKMIQKSITDMKRYLSDERSNKAEIFNFDKCNDTIKCRKCNFVKVCR